MSEFWKDIVVTLVSSRSPYDNSDETLNELGKTLEALDYHDFDYQEGIAGFIQAASDSQATGKPSVIILDLLSFVPGTIIKIIERVRNEYPAVAIIRYIDRREYQKIKYEFTSAWVDRFEHYFTLYKDDAGEPNFREKVVKELRLATLSSTTDLLRFQNDGESVDPESIKEALSAQQKNQIFLSYSRTDWDDFVLGFVKQLRKKGVKIWLDQTSIYGGEDWMDNVNAALKECEVLVLVMSPEALKSKYVRMEYRYFFNKNKAIVPVLYKPVEDIPPELHATQYIDFTRPDTAVAYAQLLQALKRYTTPKKL